MSTDLDSSPYGYERVAIFDPINKRITYLDPVDGGVLPTIDLEDSMVNRGMFFTATIRDDDLDSPNKKYIHLKVTSSDVEVHISRKSSIATNKPVSINLYESPTVTDSGTPTKTQNSDRNSLKTSTLEIYENPTISDLGNLYFPVHVKERNNPTSTMILKKRSSYLIEIVPEKKNTSIIVSLAWFEANR